MFRGSQWRRPKSRTGDTCQFFFHSLPRSPTFPPVPRVSSQSNVTLPSLRRKRKRSSSSRPLKPRVEGLPCIPLDAPVLSQKLSARVTENGSPPADSTLQTGTTSLYQGRSSFWRNSTQCRRPPCSYPAPVVRNGQVEWMGLHVLERIPVSERSIRISDRSSGPTPSYPVL